MSSKLSITNIGRVIEGTTRPRAFVHVRNMSISPVGPTRIDCIETVVRADSKGHFRAEVRGVQEGDRVRVQVRRRGERASWLDVRVKGIAARDTRRADISLQGFRLLHGDDDVVRFQALRKQRAVGEPGAKIRFINRRTRVKTDFRLDADGCLPEGASLRGKVGDTFSLRITDGNVDKHMRNECGKMVVLPAGGYAALDDPPLGRDTGGTRPKIVAHDGPMVVGGIDFDDPQQGYTGNCWLVAVASAIAAVAPERVDQIVRENDDGSFTVTLKRYDHQRRRYVDDEVHVDRDLYRARGDVLYGSSKGSTRPSKMEMWWPILEKAYAKWKGSYDAIEWGWGHEAFEALLGAEGEQLDFGTVDPDHIFAELQAAIADGRPSMVSTRSTEQKALERARLVADHAYTLVDCWEADGERYVKVRNPWGSFEPKGDGRDDGVFTLTLDAFLDAYVSAAIGPKARD